MRENDLFAFQQIMLFTDGSLVLMSAMIALYWAGEEAKDFPRIWELMIYFSMKFAVAIFLTISDTLVINEMPLIYATLPIVRGLITRVPEAIALTWMVFRMYIFRKTR